MVEVGSSRGCISNVCVGNVDRICRWVVLTEYVDMMC